MSSADDQDEAESPTVKSASGFESRHLLPGFLGALRRLPVRNTAEVVLSLSVSVLMATLGIHVFVKLGAEASRLEYGITCFLFGVMVFGLVSAMSKAACFMLQFQARKVLEAGRVTRSRTKSSQPRVRLGDVFRFRRSMARGSVMEVVALLVMAFLVLLVWASQQMWFLNGRSSASSVSMTVMSMSAAGFAFFLALAADRAMMHLTRFQLLAGGRLDSSDRSLSDTREPDLPYSRFPFVALFHVKDASRRRKWAFAAYAIAALALIAAWLFQAAIVLTSDGIPSKRAMALLILLAEGSVLVAGVALAKASWYMVYLEVSGLLRQNQNPARK